MPTFPGTAGDDTLTFHNWNYNWTIFNMGDGNDTVIAPPTNTAFLFFGEGGNDVFQGSSHTDNAFGGTGNDTLAGAGGGDFLSGDAGHDRLIGGAGSDWLKGGEGTDTFIFGRGESPSATNMADIILDWDVRADYIDSTVSGTSKNYLEFSTNRTSIEGILNDLVGASNSKQTHLFVYNEKTDTGYLFSNLDKSGTQIYETAVIINGAGSAGDMNWSDII